jgi:uncharacterized protein (DUF427 family)
MSTLPPRPGVGGAAPPGLLLPIADVRAELLELDGGVAHSPTRGDGSTFTVRAGGRQAPRAALRYTRVDILPSSRHVRIEIDGVTVAESTSRRLQLETGLPVRYYLAIGTPQPTGTEGPCARACPSACPGRAPSPWRERVPRARSSLPLPLPWTGISGCGRRP